MRKHFLILMLMALLPLAGWAQGLVNISNFSFEIGATSYEYSAATPVITSQLKDPNVIDYLTPGTHYKLVYYKNGQKVAAADVAEQVKNIGTYQVAAEGIEEGGYTGETVKVTFTITEATISSSTITLNDWDFTVGRPGSTATSATYDGKQWKPAVVVEHTVLGDLTEDEDYTISYGTNINAGTGAGTITITAKAGSNFTGNAVKTFDIAKINIPVAKYTAPAAVADLKYTGLAQNLTTAGAIATDEEYGTIQFKLGDAGQWTTVVPQGIDKGDYTVKWKIVGGTNYNDVAEATIENTKIAKAATKLRIFPIEETKVYDGNPYQLANARFTITGWAPGDDFEVQQTLTGVVAKLHGSDADETSANVGDYQIDVVLNTPTYKGTVALGDNYDIVSSYTTTWSITQRPLTITAGSATIVYGDPVPYIENEYTAVAGHSDLVAGKTYYTYEGGIYTAFVADGSETNVDPDTYFVFHAATITLTAGEGEVVSGENPLAEYQVVYGSYGDTPTAFHGGDIDVPLGEYDDAFIVTLTGTEPGNYQVTLVNGKLTVTGGPYDVITTVPNTVQYGTPIVPSCIALDAEDNPVVISKADEVEAIGYIFKQGTTVLDGAPTTIGDYSVEVDPTTIKASGNYAGGAANCQPTYFSIVPKKINLTIANVSLYNGATKAMLNEQKATVLSDYTTQLLPNEQVFIELDFSDVAYAGTVEKLSITDGKIAFADGYTTQNVIVAKLAANAQSSTLDNAHYELVFTNGGLVQNTTYTLALTGATDCTSMIAAAAANAEQEYNVSLKLNRGTSTVSTYDDGWRAFQWNALILPFDITVKELSNALGYAIVNVINPAGAGRYESGKGKVAFKLKMDNEPIPANTPIMVKTFDPFVTDAAPVNFGAKKIKAATNDLTVDASTTESGLGFKFMGTYTGVHMDKTMSDYQFLVNSDTENKLEFIKSTSSATFDIIPFNAYFLIPAAAGVHEMEISFEELDGSTTTIRQFAVENTNFSAEGWYNLNGVKMQGVPTEKGVYIQNGKKVVIK